MSVLILSRLYAIGVHKSMKKSLASHYGEASVVESLFVLM